MTVTEKVRRTVYERDQECVARGTLTGRCWGQMTVQHIVGRGMGGSHRFDGAEWLVTMCNWHNGQIEDNANARILARRAGLSVARGIAERMSGALVRYPDGTWYHLNADGTRDVFAFEDEPARAATMKE